MSISVSPNWEATARRYDLSSQAEWRKLLAHFDLFEGFALVVLLVSDADGAALCRRELEAHLQREDRTLHSRELDSPEELRRLPENFLQTSCDESTAGLWLSAVIPDYAPDYLEWRRAWESALARLNAYRNPIRDRFPCTLLFVGAPWLQEAIREIAPDLWSVRTLVVRIETVAQASDALFITPRTESPASDSPDPYFALQEAEKLRGVPGRELALADLLHRAGQGFEAADNWREAEKAYAEALELKQRHHAPPESLLSTLNELAWACHILGQVRRSVTLSEQALALARESDDQWHEAVALHNLGLAYADLGQTDRAIEYLEQQLSIERASGNRGGEETVLGNLGAAYRKQGKAQRAIEYHEQALSIAREIGDRRNEGADLGNLGVAYSSIGEARRAIGYHEQALFIAREIDDKRGECNVLGNLGASYLNLGEMQQSIEYFEESLAIARAIGDRRCEGNALANMSLSLIESGERKVAMELAEAALHIFEQIEDPNADRTRSALEEWRREAA